MELDDLKKTWQRSNEHVQRTNRDIIEMIQSTSGGPAAKLKQRFRKGMILIPLLAVFTLNMLLKKHSFMYTVFTCYFVVFLIAIMTYFFISYRQMNSLMRMEGDVRTNLQRQVQLLRTGLRWRLLLTRGLVLVFVVLLEVLLHFSRDPGLQNWSQKPVFLRIVAYAGLFLIMYLITKLATDRRYKKHMLHLEEMVQQLM